MELDREPVFTATGEKIEVEKKKEGEKLSQKKGKRIAIPIVIDIHTSPFSTFC